MQSATATKINQARDWFLNESQVIDSWFGISISEDELRGWHLEADRLEYQILIPSGLRIHPLVEMLNEKMNIVSRDEHEWDYIASIPTVSSVVRFPLAKVELYRQTNPFLEGQSSSEEDKLLRLQLQMMNNHVGIHGQPIASVEQCLYLLARTMIANQTSGKTTWLRDCSLTCRNPINMGNLDNSVIARMEDRLHQMCGSFSISDNKLGPGYQLYNPCSPQATEILHLVNYHKF